jgi:enoyl-CoA hydratase/carnithine racemase
MSSPQSILGSGAGEALRYVGLACEGSILTVTINRPEVRNALHPDACAELGRVLDLAEDAEVVRAVILTGTGERAFCAGFDLQYAAQHPEIYDDPTFGSEVVRRPARRKPLIAAVNGLALGLGFELALACDLIIAAGHARFGLPEPTVGLAAMGGGVVRLTREVGFKRAMAMILTAEIVSAEQGYRLGFVNEVCIEPALVAAKRWAEAIAGLAPLSIAASMEMAYRNLDLPDISTALDPRSYPTVLQLLKSEDAKEGRRTFVEKRPPVWKGR